MDGLSRLCNCSTLLRSKCYGTNLHHQWRYVTKDIPSENMVAFFAPFSTGIPGIPRVAAVLLLFCKVDNGNSVKKQGIPKAVLACATISIHVIEPPARLIQMLRWIGKSIQNAAADCSGTDRDSTLEIWSKGHGLCLVSSSQISFVSRTVNLCKIMFEADVSAFPSYLLHLTSTHVLIYYIVTDLEAELTMKF